MKRLLVLAVAAVLGTMSTGCCCWPYYGYGSCGPYGCPTGTCPSGSCGVNPMAPPQTGALYGTWDTIQAGYPPAQTTPMPAAPTAFAPYPTTTAMAPLESLPTY